MKQKTTTPITGETSAPSRIGLSVLSVIVLIATAWLALQGRTPATGATSPSRNADWNLFKDAHLDFVEIPAGAFAMGSDPTVDAMAFENEQWSATRNRGSVDLAAFYIGRYEVTVAQYRAFVVATNYKADARALDGAPNHPVVNVSLTDALAYARWLENQLRQSSFTPESLKKLLHAGWRVTLPTEAQWEKAARGTDGRIYPWGNTAQREFANYQGTGTVPVGSINYANCAYELADMSGNVWELTRSPYRSYPFDASSPDLQTPALFVMRGGSFNDGENTVRAAVRGGIDPGARRPFIGYRLVVTPP